MENDGAHKFAFHLRELVRDLLRLVVPWVDELDFGEAEELSAAHVVASDGRFTQRYGDSVWRVPFRRGRLLDGSRRTCWCWSNSKPRWIARWRGGCATTRTCCAPG